MSTSGAGRKGEGEIKKLPEGYEDMVQKLHEREAEQLKKVLEKRNVDTVAELQDVAKKAIATRSVRSAKEHETLKSHTILMDPKSPEIKTLRQQLNEEITAYVKAVFQQNPELKKSPSALKGRITIRSSEDKVHEFSGRDGA